MGASTGGRRVVTADPTSVDDSACRVLHADMDAFYATVELRRRPELRGLPMLVGSTRGRGVVLSATYEARAHGVRSAMPVARAQALCPSVVVVEPDMVAYTDASADVMRLFRNVTPRVEALSVDEAFLDVAGLRRIAGRPAAIAVGLRERMAAELELSCTIGVAATKFMAKLASTLAKPDGLLVVPPGQALALLHPLGVESLWGVGPKTADGLRRVGISTIGELAHLDRSTLTSLVGSAAAQKLHDLAWARDPREVVERAPESSMSADATFAADLTDRSDMSRELLRLAERVGRRMRASGQRARCVSIRVRWEDFTTVSRSQTLPAATDMTRQIHQTAVELLTRLGPQRPVRLLSVKLDQLEQAGEASGQLSFEDPPDAGWKDAEAATDAVVARFGVGVMRPASLLTPRERPHPGAGRSADDPPRRAGRDHRSTDSHGHDGPVTPW